MTIAHRKHAKPKATHKVRVGYDRTVGEETWLTPKYITEALAPFDVDPCSPPDRPWDIATTHYTKAEDGFNRPWAKKDLMWVNPPYGSECGKWVKKAADQGNSLVLIFARTDTKMFHESVFSHPNASALFVFKGRLKFCTVEGKEVGTAGAPSVIVAYGQMAKRRLEKAVKRGDIKGHIVALGEVA